MTPKALKNKLAWLVDNELPASMYGFERLNPLLEGVKSRFKHKVILSNVLSHYEYFADHQERSMIVTFFTNIAQLIELGKKKDINQNHLRDLYGECLHWGWMCNYSMMKDYLELQNYDQKVQDYDVLHQYMEKELAPRKKGSIKSAQAKNLEKELAYEIWQKEKLKDKNPTFSIQRIKEVYKSTQGKDLNRSNRTFTDSGGWLDYFRGKEIDKMRY